MGRWPRSRACGDAPAPLHSLWTSTATAGATSFPAPTPAWKTTWRGCSRSCTARRTGRSARRKSSRGRTASRSSSPSSKPGQGDDWVNNICTRPFAVDWDGDGHLDLVVGTFPGSFYLFKGQGDGKFLPKPDEIKAGDQPLKVEGHHGDPFVIDWDGDGDLDILSGSSEGGVQWAENRAGPGKPPRLEPFRMLIERGPQIEYGSILRDADLKGPLSDTRIWVDDVNCDGKLDILVGDLTSLVSPADTVAEGEFKRKFADWTKVAQRGGQRSAEFCGRTTRRSRARRSERYPAALQTAKRIHEGGQDGLRLAVLAEVITSPSVDNEQAPATPR